MGEQDLRKSSFGSNRAEGLEIERLRGVKSLLNHCICQVFNQRLYSLFKIWLPVGVEQLI